MARILLIVTGGIAAYKAPEIVRELKKSGHEVRVVLTPAAHAFVSALSLASVSGHPVRSQILDASEEGTIGHIELADWPDLVVVAPATAHSLARAAHGLADDLATTILLATRAPILWAPAMNVQMWTHPRTQSNIAVLAEWGHAFAGPDRGELACGWIGEGRMIDPQVIAQRAGELLRGAQAWRGRTVIVSAGPTRAYLDPIRFMSNASTGAMGFAIAEAAAAQGALVTLVAGPVALATPRGVNRIDVETADQMFAALDQALCEGADLLAMVAAVSDLRPVRKAPGKLEKDLLFQGGGEGSGALWTVERDLVATLCATYGAHTRFLAFAAQTVETGSLNETHALDTEERESAVSQGDALSEDRDFQVRAALRRLGVEKMRRKGVPAIFVNRVGVPGVGFASDSNTGLLILDACPRSDASCEQPSSGPTISMESTPRAIGPAKDVTVYDAGPPMRKDELARWMLQRLDDHARAAGWWRQP